MKNRIEMAYAYMVALLIVTALIMVCGLINMLIINIVFGMMLKLFTVGFWVGSTMLILEFMYVGLILYLIDSIKYKRGYE